MSNELLRHRYFQVRQQLAAAEQQAARTPGSVTLLAVSKQHPAEALRELAGAGQQAFGESYLQEALPKMAALSDLPLVWHFIGQLQSNKTRAVAEHFHWVHTVDRDKIATRLNDQRPPAMAPLNVCLQVKLAEEAGKGGVWPDQVAALAAHVRALPHLRLRGLMCIPPPQTDYAAQLAQFRQLKALLDDLNQQGFGLDTLSMGMSDDLDAAVAAGSTLVRVGTAIFGARSG